MTAGVEPSKPPRRMVLHCGDFIRVIPLDNDGKPVSQDQPEPLNCPMPQDKMVFAPSPQIDNLFDQKPYTPALANDLSSFTQVFIYTLLRQRNLAGVITYAESVLYRNMFETDALQLRTNRANQTYDARACIGWLKRDRMMRKGPSPWEIDGEETRERLGDMVSVMQWLRALLWVHDLQAFRYRWPGSAEPEEGDPGKAAGEYAHYMAEFCEIGEDYEEVQARRRVALEERGRARVREAERREAEREEAEARARR